MKKFLSLSVVVVMVAMLLVGTMNVTGVVQAEVAETENVVSVSGVGTVTVKPDIAYINVGVETQDADAGLAQQENAKKMTAVMAALKKVGILEDDIKTVQYSIYDRYDYKEDGTDVKYYVVNNNVKVTIRDIDKVGDVIDAAAGAGSNQVSSIQFGISNEDEVYAEALKLAMTSAKSKATAIMSTFGKVPGLPSRVSESSYYGGSVRMDYNVMAAEAKMSTPVSAGELTVTANVSVDYNY
ncbi:DUF541 domain-containing protein [Acidaminobacter sp. JC074]|uniref:SIMPL domain-containing protein n=1 Tax=Acidaminobacter sp. JC074 TaxID=2530199 RepID=UPI001F0FFDD9|nr:SIMPL domain-containing protein [Acidaminobacter sp. JC074]MCH4889448.1 DUF541 domain-containing protein [Acidaminobacter sp. JC074]